MVDGFRTAAPINGLASLSIDGFPEHFAGYIARVDGAAALVRFELTEAQLAVLAQLKPSREAA